MTPSAMGDVGVNLTISNDRAGPVVNQNLYVSDNWLPTANFTMGSWTFGQQGSALYGVTGGAESVAGLDGLGTFLAPGISKSWASGSMSGTLSLFAPNSQGFTALTGVAGAQDLPDLHATISMPLGSMTLGLGAYVREFGITQTGSCPFSTVTNCGGEESKVGSGFTGGISTSLGGNSLNVGVAYGVAPRGMGNYENWSRAEGEQFSVDGATGSVDGTTHSVLTANLTHPWGNGARSTIGASTQSLDVNETNTATTMVRSQQAIANIFWSPVAAVNMGLEVNWINVTRRTQDAKDSVGLFFKASSSF